MVLAAGLCDTCRFHRVIETRSGSRFILCERSRTDPSFPRYPRLPVLACHGYGREAGPAATPGHAAPTVPPTPEQEPT